MFLPGLRYPSDPSSETNPSSKTNIGGPSSRLSENDENLEKSRKLWRSNSFPRCSDAMDRRQSHEQIAVEAVSDAAPHHGGNMTVNIKWTPEHEQIANVLYSYAKNNRWMEAREAYSESPDLIGIPVTYAGDTALHVAVSANNTDFVQELVRLMKPEHLEIKNLVGNTAFCMAAISGNDDFIQIMITENDELPQIPGYDGMLPVHLAALNGRYKIVRDLSSLYRCTRMKPKDIQRLFFMILNHSYLYDAALELLKAYPAILATARDHEKQLTAFHVLAGKLFKESRDYTLLLEELWSHVRQLKYNEILNLMTKPSAALFDAVKYGNTQFVKVLLRCNPAFLTLKDSEERTLLHLAALYRHNILLSVLLKTETVHLVARAVDINDNNVLHFAAQQPLEETSGQFSFIRPNIQMQREIAWFKVVEKTFPPELRTMKNRKDMTPKDIFYSNHKKLSEDVKEAAKGIANSGMVVATLVATVVFAAALTVPGDKTNGWFIVFILSNAVALFSSSASIISFLSIFSSSRFTENEYMISLHPTLILGSTLLYISIVAMVVAFAATSFLIFDHTSKWVAYLVAPLGSLPILLFLVLQYNLFDGFKDYIYWSRHYHLPKL